MRQLAGELRVLNTLADIQRRLGRYGEAGRCYQQLLDLACELGSDN